MMKWGRERRVGSERPLLLVERMNLLLCVNAPVSDPCPVSGLRNPIHTSPLPGRGGALRGTRRGVGDSRGVLCANAVS